MPALLPWSAARDRAHTCAAALEPVVVPLSRAAGLVLARDCAALSHLPAADTSAMDGWAVAGSAPWHVEGTVLAGGGAPAPLLPGQAVAIATGAVVPAGAVGVLRREWGRLEPGASLVVADDAPARAREVLAGGRDIRRAGSECTAGEVVVAAGSVLTPVRLAMLAAAGHNDVPVRQALVDVLVLGDELVLAGPAQAGGRLRDALGPLLAAWLPARGAALAGLTHVADTRGALSHALAATTGDVVVTTGSTARGAVDHLHGVLEAAGARLVVDGVAVRPGHPQLLAVLPDGRPLVGLPGNPLAAVSGIFTLVEPVLAALHGGPLPPTSWLAIGIDVAAGEEATRLVPLRDGVPVRYAGPAMLRGLTVAEAVAVIPPGGVRKDQRVRTLALP